MYRQKHPSTEHFEQRQTFNARFRLVLSCLKIENEFKISWQMNSHGRNLLVVQDFSWREDLNFRPFLLGPSAVLHCEEA
jgi:hypothetical protein